LGRVDGMEDGEEEKNWHSTGDTLRGGRRCSVAEWREFIWKQKGTIKRERSRNRERTTGTLCTTTTATTALISPVSHMDNHRDGGQGWEENRMTEWKRERGSERQKARKRESKETEGEKPWQIKIDWEQKDSERDFNTSSNTVL
jgi:hypothetical protein